MDFVQGQDRAMAVLQRQLAANRLHHGYLFYGPWGVGKFTAAAALAKVILCHEPTRTLTGDLQACQGCPSCQLLEQGDADASAHPDLHVIRKELAAFSDDPRVRSRKQLSIPVDIVRQHLVQPAGLAASLRHGKVFIIDEAELLGNDAQNAMLKTLEEPTPGTVIILVTASEDKLLATIRSRCQRLGFVPLDESIIAGWMDRQDPPIEESVRPWLLGFAQGSIGRAQTAVEYGLSQEASGLLPLLDDMAGGQPRAELGSQIEGCLKSVAEARVKRFPQASKEAANRWAAGLTFSLLTTYAQGKMKQASESLEADPARADEHEAVMSPWLGVIDAAHESERLLGANVNLSLVCDRLMIQAGRHLMAAAR